MTKKLDNQEEITALLKGLGILGTGGGGSPEEFGRPVLEADLTAGRATTLVSPDDVEDEALIVCGGYLGSVADPIDVNEVIARWEKDFEFGRAVRELERYLGRKVDYLLPTELGGGNTIVTLTAGARLGVPVVDGDTAGRAVPETPMTSMSLTDVTLTPLDMIDLDGNVVFLDRCKDALFADQLGRFLVTRTHGMVATVGSSMSGATLKKGVIPGSVSGAVELGKACSLLSGDEKSDQESKLRGVARAVHGWPAFWGTVAALEADNTRGHYYLKATLQGKGSYSGDVFRLVIKNETMAGWVNGRLICMLPDLLLMLDPTTLEGIMSPDIRVMTEMLIVAAPCHARLRQAATTTASGRSAFSSERYYENMPYRPVGELIVPQE